MSEMGSLSGCILENDPQSVGRARLLRGKALAASIGLEATVILALVVWPLLSPGMLGGKLTVTPVPPYHGGGGELRRAEHSFAARNDTPQVCRFCWQPTAPTHPSNSAGARKTASGDPPDFGLGFGGDLIGPMISGAEDGGGRLPIEIKKPEPPAHPAPRKMSEEVMAAALIYKVQPIYPAIARIMHLSGTVRLRAIISTDGRIRELEVISGSPYLQAAAVAAVREWRYRPTLLNGVPCEVETLITVNFILD
jgi:periplasmic protein TonB